MHITLTPDVKLELQPIKGWKVRWTIGLVILVGYIRMSGKSNMLGLAILREAPPGKKTCLFEHCPNHNLTPPIAQIQALCGTNFLPKMRKFLKQQFWLWEWIFWQWLRSKMILRWYSDGNQGKYWWNWWKLSGPVMVYIHWRTATNNLGKRFDPPPPFERCPNLHSFPLVGASLIYTYPLSLPPFQTWLMWPWCVNIVAGQSQNKES